MSIVTNSDQQALHRALATELLRMARAEEDSAADEAGRVRYWETVPSSVQTHWQCARLLREAAGRWELAAA